MCLSKCIFSFFPHLSDIAYYLESASPRPITVFKSSGPKSSFLCSLAICTSTVRVRIGTVIFHADAVPQPPEWCLSR